MQSLIDNYEAVIRALKADNTALQAQAAVMGKALADLLEHGGMGGEVAAAVCDQAEQALSVAPEVLVHRDARLLTFDDKSQVLLFPPDKYFGAEGAVDQDIYDNPDEGLPDSVGFPKVEDVKVLVTKCSPHPKQAQESEQ